MSLKSPLVTFGCAVEVPTADNPIPILIVVSFIGPVESAKMPLAALKVARLPLELSPRVGKVATKAIVKKCRC